MPELVRQGSVYSFTISRRFRPGSQQISQKFEKGVVHANVKCFQDIL